MKPYTYYYKLFVAFCILATGLDGFAQGKNLEKTYRWSYQVDESVQFTFNNYDCDLNIHTWDKAEIEYHMEVKAEMKSAEDASKLDEHIDRLEFSRSAGHVAFDNRFWSNKNVGLGRKTITLRGKGKVRFSELSMEGELWIPESCILDLKSKYSEIELEDIQGLVSLDLYNDKLFGGTLGSPVKIAAKYSTLEFEKVEDIEADLYNTNLETGDAGDLQLVSKYSDVRTGNAGKIRIDAYNDNYAFENTGDIKFTDKYSDLSARNSGDVQLDCYNSTLHLVSARDIEVISKYGKYTIDKAHKLNLGTGYNDNFSIGSLQALNIDVSKYGVYKVDHLESSLLLKDGYSDKFFVTKTGDFKELKVNGKYIDLEMVLQKDLNYRFEAQVKYPEFEIDEDAMQVREKIQEGANLQMKAVRGLESEYMPAFFINGYEMAVTLTEGL